MSRLLKLTNIEASFTPNYVDAQTSDLRQWLTDLSSAENATVRVSYENLKKRGYTGDAAKLRAIGLDPAFLATPNESGQTRVFFNAACLAPTDALNTVMMFFDRHNDAGKKKKKPTTAYRPYSEICRTAGKTDIENLCKTAYEKHTLQCEVSDAAARDRASLSNEIADIITPLEFISEPMVKEIISQFTKPSLAGELFGSLAFLDISPPPPSPLLLRGKRVNLFGWRRSDLSEELLSVLLPARYAQSKTLTAPVLDIILDTILGTDLATKKNFYELVNFSQISSAQDSDTVLEYIDSLEEGEEEENNITDALTSRFLYVTKKLVACLLWIHLVRVLLPAVSPLRLACPYGGGGGDENALYVHGGYYYLRGGETGMFRSTCYRALVSTRCRSSDARESRR